MHSDASNKTAESIGWIAEMWHEETQNSWAPVLTDILIHDLCHPFFSVFKVFILW